MTLIIADAFSVTQYITHPISLLAYIAAAVMVYFINRDVNRRKLIESAPEAERANVIIQTAEKLHMDITAVPRNERAALIRQVLKNRIYTQLIIAFVILVIGMMGSYIVLNFLNKNIPKPVAPRVQIGDITARVTFYIGEASENSPEIFKNTSQLELRIAENTNFIDKNVIGWKNGFFLPDSLSKVASTTQRFDRNFKATVDGPSLELVREYDKFTGSLKAFGEGYDWKKASFEGLINVSEFNPWVDSLINENSDYQVSFEDFADEYRITPEQRVSITEYDYRVIVYPIRAMLELFCKGKPIGRSDGIVVRVYEHDEDVRRLFVVKFPVTKLSIPEGI
ncbi:MAG TPA: hypothetical protein VK541_01595 [Pedobacter sp.]|uniref:hypothetical protein n=1 Tax=Pedobacter sp. TaxID=1411316 RepID=UPI002C673A7F|nr:hypothetical protein [Pedobacter sp.]HMI01142.1 hypothetical protein [Pedobacter sp.]